MNEPKVLSEKDIGQFEKWNNCKTYAYWQPAHVDRLIATIRALQAERDEWKECHKKASNMEAVFRVRIAEIHGCIHFDPDTRDISIEGTNLKEVERLASTDLDPSPLTKHLLERLDKAEVVCNATESYLASHGSSSSSELFVTTKEWQAAKESTD